MQALCWNTVRLPGRDGRDSLPAFSEEQSNVRTRAWRSAKKLNPLANFEVLLNKADVSIRP